MSRFERELRCKEALIGSASGGQLLTHVHQGNLGNTLISLKTREPRPGVNVTCEDETMSIRRANVVLSAVDASAVK
jgi:hypothetical protein